MTILCMGMFYSLLSGQTAYTLSGRVVDENERPLPGATIAVLPGSKVTQSNTEGYFQLNDLYENSYTLTVSFMGYDSYTDTVYIDNDRTCTIRLRQTSVSLQEVVVTHDYADEKKKEEALPVDIVTKRFLWQNMGGSLMQSLQILPGVGSLDIGAGQSKPIIRGLGFNRVIVVENGMKHEAQQWGSDHGLEVDQYAVENVEVIKGPLSLLYGSEAIGGVIDMKSRTYYPENTFGGSVDLSGKTSNQFLGTSVSLYGRRKSFFADLRATVLDYGDYTVPTDSVNIYSYRAPLYKHHLRNTAGKEQNIHFSFGVIRPEFESRFYLSNIHTKNGFFANAHGLEPLNVDTEMHDASNRDSHYPYQDVNHFKINNITRYRWTAENYVETQLGFQRNIRDEWSQYISHGYMPSQFPDTLGFTSDLERAFDKSVYSGRMTLALKKDKKTFNAGINAEYQDNKIDGRGFIIPAFKQIAVGGYLFGKLTIGAKSVLQAGIRYDFGRIMTEEYFDWFLSPLTNEPASEYRHLQRAHHIDRRFSSISWSAGYNLNLERWSFKSNIGKSFRMPIAKELAANGVNYHQFSYEVGNPDLSPEMAYQWDIGADYVYNRLSAGISPFVNYFTNYIYLNPTSEHDRLYGNGNQVFYYMQSRVLRYGAEMHVEYQILPQIQIGWTGEYVYSEQLSGVKKGFTLPFSPPPSMRLHAGYLTKKLARSIENAYVSLDHIITAPQNNIVPPEDPTPGHQVLNIGAGGDLKWGKQPIQVSLQIQNLLNTKYFNHTSYYKLIHVPEPGRNIVIHISIPFSGKIKST